MGVEGVWMFVVGNVVIVMCFVICLILNVNFIGGLNRVIFLLVLILLLFN